VPLGEWIFLTLVELLKMLPGVPHQLTTDDEYRGYFLPKDTTVLVNAWCGRRELCYSPGAERQTPRAITRNEELYPEPEKFNPERFRGKMNSEAAHQVDSIFGFGRRVCPGKVFAEANVWLLMANIVATMNIEKTTDEMGQPMTPNGEYIGSYVRYGYPCFASGISVVPHL
jgi:hypothetical protein